MATGGEPDYRWDLFISCHPNQLSYVLRVLTQALESIGLRVYLYERDSEPGAPIADNIFNAATMSRKTIMCFTSDYLDSEWNLYEAMAAHGVKPSGGRMVPLQLLSCEIPQKYQLVCQLDCTDRLHRLFFWRKLLGALGIPDSSDIATQLNIDYPGGGLDMLSKAIPDLIPDHDVIPDPPRRSERTESREQPQQRVPAPVVHQENLTQQLFLAVLIGTIICKILDALIKFVFGF